MSPKRGRTTLMLMAALIFAGEIAASFLIDRAPLKIRFPQLAKIIDSSRQLQSSKLILFFGTSRFGNAISAETVSQVLHESNAGDGFSVLKAAVGAGDPVALEFLTGKLLAANVHVSIAVIEILPEVLSRRNLWLHYHLARQFRWPEVWNSLYDAYLAGKLSDVISTRFNAVYMFRSEFQRWAMDALKLHFQSSNPDGKARKRRRRDPAEPADVAVLEAGAIAGRKRMRGYEIGGLNARGLDKMIERYAKLETTVVLIAPPVSSPYRMGYQSPVDEVYLDYMERLGKRYGTHFFDYRHRLPDREFYTPYYPTTDGKLHFSRLLAREILVPLITGKKGDK
jgi:hypothetical protein